MLLPLIAIIAVTHWYYNHAIQFHIARWLPFVVLAATFTQYHEGTWFSLLKLEGVMTALLMTNLAKWWQGPVPEWLSDYVFPMTMCVNILQAVGADTSLLNGGAGLLLCVKVVQNHKSLLQKRPDGQLLVPALAGRWAYAYTLWNAVLVYGYASDVCGKLPKSIIGVYSLIFLVMLIVPWIKEQKQPGSFVEARTYTLALFLPLAELICYNVSSVDVLPLLNAYDPAIHTILAVASYSYTLQLFDIL